MSKLVQAFNISNKTSTTINDYDIFPNKELLELLKNRVIASVSDAKKENNKITSELISTTIDNIIKDEDLTSLQRNHLFNIVDNEMNGYGPITELMSDNAVNSIMVNSPSDIYISNEYDIKKDESVSFINDEHIIKTIKKIIEPLNLTIDTANPIINAKINNYATIEAIIPPISARPIFTIKKSNEVIVRTEELIRLGTLTPDMAKFLNACVDANLNIIVCGGNNSGKSNLLNSLATLVHKNERVVTIEEDDELEINLPNLIRLHNNKNNDAILSAKKLMANRIIIDEITKSNAFYILELMNNQDCVASTIRATSASDAIANIENFIAISYPSLKYEVIKSYITKSVDIIITITRLKDGKRRITSIAEVSDSNKDLINEIYTFNNTGLNLNKEITGEFVQSNKVPEVYRKIKISGIDYVDDLFTHIK